ncbi:hypothetical protein Ndes2526B_g04225 [Nannochloris sp. 'desiccata']|nr:hypothetical protein KSW81_001005 [Chlorella desiccata (nom. nud.)]KAH7620305.1 putative U3 small nucleolar RNA-associated protein 14 [Chlorella desiccata (nom. nud.)]
MAKPPGRGRGKRSFNNRPRASEKQKFKKDDVYEADDSLAEEDKSKMRYDRVDNYEYELPSDFEDEEIDDEQAFNSEDERMYGHLFKNKQGGDASEEEEDEDEEDDLLHSEDDDEQENISDSEEENDDEEDSELEDVFAKAGAASDGDSPRLFGSDEEEAEEEGDDDEDEYEMKEARREAMVRAVTDGAVCGEGKNITGRRRKKEIVVTEVYPESEFNLPAAGAGGELTLADLIAGLGDNRAKLGSARKTLERLEKKTAPVAAPLPGPIRDRQERKAGYEAAKEDIAKWMPVVKAHREAPTLHFKADVSAVERTVTTASLAAKHEPETAMEAEVAALLQAAGAQTAAAVAEAEEALAMKALTVGEAKERREKLAKMRALMFYHEMKAKRLKKIKSKEYRRRLKKAEKRKAEAGAGEGGADLLLDEDELRQAQEEAEFNRAQERLTLKHKNTSRFIRRALKRGGAGPMDEGTKQAVAEQLRLGEELRKKVHKMNAGGDSSDTDASDDNHTDDTSASASEGDEEDNNRGRNGRGQLSSKAKAAALEILNGRSGDDGGPEVPTEGLFALPFMQRAMERRRAQAAEEARELLDMDNDDPGGINGDVSAHDSGGRMAFRGTGEAEKLAQRVRQLEAAALSCDSEAEGDEREDVEAKAERLGRKLLGGDSGEAHLKEIEGEDDDDLGSLGKSGVLRKVSRHQGKISGQDRLFNSAAIGINGGGAAAVEAAIASGTGIEVSVGPRSSSKKKNAAEENSEGPQPAVYISSKKFQGAKPGYVFYKGPKGVGYYIDTKASSNGTSKQAKKNSNSKNSKNKSKPAAVSVSDEEADEEGYMRPSEKSSFGNTNNRKTASASAMDLTQEDLVRRAFAGDDVVSEFSKEKLAEVEEELPKEEVPGAVPGWGTWANAKREPRWAVEAKVKAAARKEAAAASRKDAALQYVVISEKWDKKNAKYRTPEVPFPFNSKETYERAMRQPLGRDFNTAAAFRNLTRPEVVKDAGVIIQPVRFSAAMAEHAKQGETTKGSKRPGVLTVEGGMPKKQKLEKNKGGQKGKRRGLGE